MLSVDGEHCGGYAERRTPHSLTSWTRSALPVLRDAAVGKQAIDGATAFLEELDDRSYGGLFAGLSGSTSGHIEFAKRVP